MNIKSLTFGILSMLVITCFIGCVTNNETETDEILKTFVVTESESKWIIDDGALQMDFPDDAIEDELTIVIKTVQGGDESDAYIPNTLYSFEPDGTKFKRLVKLSIQYNQDDLPPGINESDLKIGKLIEGSWHPINGTVDTDNNIVSTFIWSFTRFGMICANSNDHDWWGSFLEVPSDISPFDMDEVIDPEDKIKDSEDEGSWDFGDDEIIHLDSPFFCHDSGDKFSGWTKISGDWYGVKLDGHGKMTNYFTCNGTKFQYDSLAYNGVYSDVDFLVSTDLDSGSSISIIVRGQIYPLNSIGNWNSYYKLTFEYSYGQYSLHFNKKIDKNTTTLWEDQGFVPNKQPTSTEHEQAFRVVMIDEHIYIYYSYFDPYNPNRDYEELLWSGNDSDIKSGSIGIMGFCSRSDVRYKLFWTELWL